MENNDLLLDKLIELENTIDFERAEYIWDHIKIFIILDWLYKELPFYKKEYHEFKKRFSKYYNIEHYNHKFTNKIINSNTICQTTEITAVLWEIKSYNDIMLMLDQYN
jgi:hypothetical protein